MATKTSKKTAKQKRILIVEDEHPLAHALELKLRSKGFDTAIAVNGKEGVEKAIAGKFDLVLLDLILPGLDGFAFLEQVRRKQAKLPIVILSNLGQEEDKQRTAKFNVSEYHVKANTPLAVIVSSITSLLQ